MTKQMSQEDVQLEFIKKANDILVAARHNVETSFGLFIVQISRPTEDDSVARTQVSIGACAKGELQIAGQALIERTEAMLVELAEHIYG